jgi:hypothetical protein
MLRPRGGFSNQNEFEKAQVENLVTNENLVTTYKNLWKWLLELDGIMVIYVQITSYVQSAYNT